MAGIYIHIPFCATRCIYCDFYSTTLRGKGAQFVAALEREIVERKGFIKERVRTLYLGGGTPSQLGPSVVRDILDVVARHYDLSQCEEVTMEANPEDFVTKVWPLTRGAILPESRLSENCLSAPRINRISMGVQSMVDTELHLLNRRHDAAHVREAVALLRKAGIGNLSLDLMYGLPKQTIETWEYSIDQVLKLEPEHISAYSLMVEEGTRLNKLIEKGELTPCDDETVIRMAELLREKLKQAGYEQYEISNYARPEYHSRHNSSYWVQTPYLGLGPGAHSYDGELLRCWNEPRVMNYLNGKREEGSERLTPEDLYNERVMLGLRTRKGVPLSYLDRSNYQPFINRGLARIKQILPTRDEPGGAYLSLTEAGLALADEVMRELMIIPKAQE